MAFLRRLDLNVILLCLLSLFVIVPLTRPGFPATGAGFRPVWELSLLAEGMGWPSLDGAFQPLRMDGLLPRYVAFFFYALVGDPLAAIRWSLALPYIIGGLALYGWLQGRWGKAAALLAGVVYTFLPYRLAVTYIAGGLGEPWALGLYPAVGWALWRLSERLTPGRTAVALCCWGLLVLCNAGLAVWFAFIAGVAMVAMGRPIPVLIPLLPALPLALWGIVTGSRGVFDRHFVYLFQLFSAGWQSVPTSPGWIQDMPYQLGIVPLGLAILALALGATSGTRQGRRSLLLLTIGLVIVTMLTLHASELFWRLSRFDRLLSYPWQMLGFAGLGLALLSGSVIRYARPLAGLPWLAGLVALMVVSTYNYLEPAWTDLVPPDRPAALFGAGQIALVDCEIAGQFRPGSHIEIQVTWQALRPLSKDYTVFVQVLDELREIRAQEDTQPLAGKSPTSGWMPGQIISDIHAVKIEASEAAERYDLIIGFYDATNGHRMAVNGDDKVTLARSVGQENRDWLCREGSHE